MTATVGPFTSSDFDLTELTEQYVADRDLSVEAIEWLRNEFNELTSDYWERAGIASAWMCAELDLPQGSTCAEVVASLLDACLNPMKQTHLTEMREHLI